MEGVISEYEFVENAMRDYEFPLSANDATFLIGKRDEEVLRALKRASWNMAYNWAQAAFSEEGNISWENSQTKRNMDALAAIDLVTA
jgi:hypothetical protein